MCGLNAFTMNVNIRKVIKNKMRYVASSGEPN